MNSSPLVTFSIVRIAGQVVLCAVLAITTGTAVGQTLQQANPNIEGNWSTAGNWTLGVPNASSGTAFDARIDNGGTARLSVAGATVRRLRMGTTAGGGDLIVDGGALTVTENLHVNEGAVQGAPGHMRIENGGTVTSPSTVVGYSGTGISFIEVNGAGSHLNATNSFIAGRAAIGTIRLSDFGELTIGGGSLPLQVATMAGSVGNLWITGNSGPTGPLVASAVEFGAGRGQFLFWEENDITFAIPISGPAQIMKVFPGTVTTLTSDNTYTNGTDVIRGTLDVVGSISHPAAALNIGFEAGVTAVLIVRDGGSVTNAASDMALGANSIGFATVDDAGSTWTNHGELNVGLNGAGNLSITAGGVVSNAAGIIGRAVGSSGAVSVDGAGSKWMSFDDMAVGNFGTATLSVTAGGVVSNDNGSVGASTGSTGAATINGAGSEWNNAGELTVGWYASGALHIQNGGAVSNTVGRIGREAGSNGAVVVDGPGSTWTNTGALTVAGAGHATLTVQNGGGVSSASTTINTNGTVAGNGTIDGNVSNSGFVNPGAPLGTLQIDGNYSQSSTGILTIFADLFETNVPATKLDVTGNIALNGRLQMNLVGMGQFRGTRTIDILDWDGNLTGFFSTLQLPMLGGTLTWDTSQLYITGELTLTGPPPEGNFNLDGFVDAADYVMWRKQNGSEFNYGKWRQQFGMIVAQPGSGSALDPDSPATVPEPSTVMLLMCAATGWSFRRGRPPLKVAETQSRTKLFSNPPFYVYLECMHQFRYALVVASDF